MSVAFPQNSQANILEGFIFKPAFTLELQRPEIMADDQDDQFRNGIFEKQLANAENVVFGLNLRLHKYFGINGNWSKFTMKNDNGLTSFAIDNKAELEINNFNLSSLFYFPLIGDGLLEAFAEFGVSDINSNLEFSTSSTPQSHKSHQSAFLYGGGIQFAPYESSLAFRATVLKHNADIPLINASLITYRIGLVKYF